MDKIIQLGTMPASNAFWLKNDLQSYFPQVDFSKVHYFGFFDTDTKYFFQTPPVRICDIEGKGKGNKKMNELQLIKSAKFGEIECDIYGKANEVYMTINQLSETLEYASKKSLEKLIAENDYLRNPEFSIIEKVPYPTGGTQQTRIFTEDGIYEVTMLSKTEKAKEFRAWFRAILKSLRKGEAKLVNMTEYQRMMAQTRAENARIRKAQILTRLAEKYEGTTYQQVLNSYATKELTGEHLLPLPKLEAKTYTAKEIGEMLGITANMVGIITNRHNLKTEQYGKWFCDKAKGHDKEVQSFRYYENIIPILEQIIKQTA